MEHPCYSLPLTHTQILTTDNVPVASAIKKGSVGWVSHIRTANGGLCYRIYFYRFGAGGRARVCSSEIGPFKISTQEPFPIAIQNTLIDVTTLTKEPLIAWLSAMLFFLRRVSREYVSRDFSSAFIKPGTFMYDLNNIDNLYENHSDIVLGKAAKPEIIAQTIQQLRQYQTCIAPAIDMFYTNITTQIGNMLKPTITVQPSIPAQFIPAKFGAHPK